jgi:cytoskeleton protein RodZ
MSDVATNGSVDAEATTAETVADAAVEPQVSAGALLRQAREAAGTELGSLAVALKVSVKKLEALEGDRFDLLPDAVFVRALASSVCRALKIDASPVLARLPQSVAPRLQYDAPGLNTPFHTPGDVAKTPFWDRLSRPMVLAALAVLMGTLVLIFFPSSEQRAEIGAIVARAPTTTPAAPEAAEAVPEPVLVPTTPVVTPPAATVAPKAAAPAPPKAVAPVAPKAPPAAAAPVARPIPAAAPVVAPVAAAAPAGADAAPPVRKKLASTGIVVFKTTEPSWIEVTDARGVIQLSRVIEPGEPVGASGPLPLNVSIGRADVTEVQVRGKPFPLQPVTKQGVARFEVQ